MQRNLILRADSYKYGQFLQRPLGTTEMSAYIEARKGGLFNEVCFVGLQPWLKEYLSQPIHGGDVIEARVIAAAHGDTFDELAWLEIAHGKLRGHLPIEIQALPEGTVVPTGTPLVQVRNTDGKNAWLATFIETQLLRAIWYPSTVATLSREAKKIIYAGLLRSSDDPDGQIPWKLHDFGARGVSSSESAELGGMAHLVNFMGSDTIEGVMAVRRYYSPGLMPSGSIDAAEHSTVTAWGRDGEKQFLLNMIDKFGKPGRLFAAPIDSYDDTAFIKNVVGDPQVKERLINSGSKYIARPDSGDPVMNPIRKLEQLAEVFGHSFNGKKYAVLPPCIGVIQGDGMNLRTIRSLVEHTTLRGFSIDNIAMGMGGGLLQMVNRDDLRFAMKANEIVINGVRQDVQKDPKTDPGKASKAGRQAVMRLYDGEYISQREDAGPIWNRDCSMNLLQTVWRDGVLLRDQTFEEVRANAAL